MKNNLPSPAGCPGHVSRRDFITSCATCALGLAALPVLRLAKYKTGTRNIRIHVIYALHALVQDRPDWPNIGFDFNPVIEKINRRLIAGCPDFDFHTYTATGPKDAEVILEADKPYPVDGYIVFQMNCWNQVVQTIATTGKPVLYADFQFGGSGGFLVYNAGFLRNNIPNIAFVSSSKMEDIVDAVNCFRNAGNGHNVNEFVNAVSKIRKQKKHISSARNIQPDNINLLSSGECLAQLKETKILAVRDEKEEKGNSVMGIPLDYIPFSVVNEAWQSADKDEAKEVAENWRKRALNIKDVSPETLTTSAAMYLGMKSVLKNYNARAITINCLGGFYGGHIHAYPCLGFHELNNEGLVGACECDISSTATMLTFTTLTRGRPGYISDPVIDTSKGQIIYAHCVASNKAFGSHGPVNEFEIMTHSEDRQGASVRSLLPVNYLTTSLQMNNERKEVLMHQAIAVANDPDDRACRTKLCAEPTGDIEKLFSMWDQWGWHRVTFYGDLKKPVYQLAETAGWKVIEEA